MISVGELFAEAGIKYEIPIYQRNYSWRNLQIEQLIDDVWTAVQDDPEGEYFLGNLIVAAKSRKSDASPGEYEVVDGQQRLTTLFMLLSRLGIDPTAKLTYASRQPATDDLTRLKVSENDGGSGILAGFKVIDARISRFDEAGGQLEQFTEFLRNQVKIVRAVLADETDLNKYFEIMNTRGRQLEPVDIVKARLMSYLRSCDNGAVDEKRACFAWIWDACADMDIYIQMALARGNTDSRDRLFGKSWDSLKVRTFRELLPLQPVREAQVASRSNGVGLADALRIYAQLPELPPDSDDESGRFESPIRFPSLLLHTLKVLGATEGDANEVDGHLDDGKLIKRFDDEFRGLGEVERSAKAEYFAEALLRCKFILDNFILNKRGVHSDEWRRPCRRSLKRLVRKESPTADEKKLRINVQFPSAYATGTIDADGDPTDATRKCCSFNRCFE